MTRYVISGVLGHEDRYRLKAEVDEVVTRFDLLNTGGHLAFGVDRTLMRMAAMSLSPTAIGVDLITLAALVHTADTRVSRFQTAQDGWTRELSVVVPVSDPDRWNAAVPTLDRMLRFLTGDLWKVRFRALAGKRPGASRVPRVIRREDFDGVSLFSGGLDSLIGAIDELKGGRRPLFVSHGGEGGVSGPQRRLFRTLDSLGISKKPLARVRLGMVIPHHVFEGIAGENSTRGRSFLFIALGIFAGTALRKSFTLRVPENGLISLNVPLDETRLGSNSTRTTHPFYIHRWNELLDKIGIDATIENPYWNRTKGQMVAECVDADALQKLAPMSVSCAHPSTKRWSAGSESHCGYCLPCIIRRSSLLKAPWTPKDETGYAVPDLTAEIMDTNKAKGRQIRGFQFTIARLAKNPELAKLWIYKPGSLAEDAAKVPELVRVYEDGMAEVAELLKRVRAAPLDQRSE
ncbi:Qat anti-phage system QueC-like protein QatC [Mesorhizobium sp. B2-4-6]|uniref:Qat anti-phage system QueC-like protein QatC n=1 Tax=Mesorhizobium sp. B2-4-6 TaxID=2589943 RepID=UPI001125D637|nr:Qat anti-phage system QueC-like protein QatC [Mesorhizobium sp. B2-4-6]TPL51516.1 hypothetical protein FJ957_07970 [Mesorhizobium sp. B2-4-6]